MKKKMNEIRQPISPLCAAYMLTLAFCRLLRANFFASNIQEVPLQQQH
jgi:hypothetical protein